MASIDKHVLNTLKGEWRWVDKSHDPTLFSFETSDKLMPDMTIENEHIGEMSNVDVPNDDMHTVDMPNVNMSSVEMPLLDTVTTQSMSIEDICKEDAQQTTIVFQSKCYI